MVVIGFNASKMTDYNGSYKGLSMWKSKDGIKFEAEKGLNRGNYDTPNAAVVRGDTINFYFRVWHNKGNRQISYV